MKASFLADPRLFFCVLRTLAELRSVDCRFGGLCVCVAVFSAEKTSGRVRRCGAERNNASCGWLHLIRFATLSTFPSRGRLFYCRLPKRLPLEGKLANKMSLMRCSAPQSAFPHPARFAAAKRRSPAGATTQAGGRPGRLCRPGARSAQKKRAEISGSSLLESLRSTLFFDKPAEPIQPKTAFRVGFGGTKSAAALWQIKVDGVPMRHRVQRALRCCTTMPNCGQALGSKAASLTSPSPRR